MNKKKTDRKLRANALSSLHTFLSAKHVASALKPLDVLKLWKGLFFALWMCDRAIPQQNLCNDLADLVFVLPTRDAVVTWLRGFWATMSREWTGIDVLRMEKFLLLVRRVVCAGFKWMKKNGGKEGGKKSAKKSTSSSSSKSTESWDAKKVDDILKLLNDWPFALDEDLIQDDDKEEEEAEREKENDLLAPKSIPVGLKLHVLDIWVDEAEKVGLLDEEDEEASKILERIIEMVDTLERRTVSPAVRVRSKEALADDRLPGNKKPVEADGDDAEAPDAEERGSWDGFDD